MLRYVLGRLLLMIPTLFGITLVTFAIVHLMPGKPGDFGEEGARGVRPEVLEAQRRRYFFDLPLFFNFSIEDGPVAVKKLIGRATVDTKLSAQTIRDEEPFFLTPKEIELLSENKNPELLQKLLEEMRKRGQQDLVKHGGAAVPIVYEDLDSLAEPLSASELENILAGLAEVDPAKDPTDKNQVKARWSKWWEEKQSLYTQENVFEQVEEYLSQVSETSGPSAQDYLKAADPALLQELMLLGTFTLGELIYITQSDDYTDEEVGAVAALLSEITGVSYSFSPLDVENENYEKIDNVCRNWREWWRQYRRDYEAYSAIEKIFGVLTETQYAKWVARILAFEFGTSQVQAGRPVIDMIVEALPNTAKLALLSLFFAYLISIPLGVSSAVNQGTFYDRATTFVLFVLYSMPSFWVALMLILLFCGQGFLAWFPVTGLHSQNPADYPYGSAFLDTVWHMILPLICLTYASLASLSRYQRVGLLDVLRQDYIRTARAKGLSERVVIWKHAVRNSLLPVITLLGVQIPYLVGGAVIAEQIFDIPGMGRVTFAAIQGRDYPVVMAVAVLTAMATMISLLISDILYALADPRISYNK